MKDREAQLAYHREYYKLNRERLLEEARKYAREYRKRNHEQIKETVKQWRDANKERHRLNNAEAQARRRARLYESRIEPVKRTSCIQRLIDTHGLICGICGLPLNRSQITLDHIQPLSKGGAHIELNLQLAHRRCNERKGNR